MGVAAFARSKVLRKVSVSCLCAWVDNSARDSTFATGDASLNDAVCCRRVLGPDRQAGLCGGSFVRVKRHRMSVCRPSPWSGSASTESGFDFAKCRVYRAACDRGGGFQARRCRYALYRLHGSRHACVSCVRVGVVFSLRQCVCGY